MNESAVGDTQPNSHCRADIKGFHLLEELALNLSWSWNHCSDLIWKQLDAPLWDLTQNPWVVLQTVSKKRLEELLATPSFYQAVEKLVNAARVQMKTPGWFQTKYPNPPLSAVAYFSMEFMLTEALPIYSGGLGNVAGDQLKAASELGVPVVAIGLLYQQGYFRQMIDKNGIQQAYYPYNNPGQLPISPLRKADGEWLRLEVRLPGYSLWLRAWQVQVGGTRLYLLDSNDPANFPAHRGITSELYGGDSELRLKQELLLGIGGWRLLEAINIKREVCHLNEGHAGFAVLERARSFMESTKCSFDVAFHATRAGNLFTTHTAVPAGFDRFHPSLMRQYLGEYAEKSLKININDLLALGRLNPQDNNEDFNMAYLAARGSGAINGVSKLHGEVSRHIFAPLFPHWPEDEVPIGSITNGVHMPSWDSIYSDHLWTKACGKGRWLGTTECLKKDIDAIPNVDIWKMRSESREALVSYVRKTVHYQLAARGAFDAELKGQHEFAQNIFDSSTLTLGFARRFATYKRPNMLLHDPDRLLRILSNPQRPVQLIIAGKAHPADKPGIDLIQKWMRFIAKPEVRSHVLFIGDYDILVAEELVRGVDVWVNTPRRPWEACGTSGMKVLVNGGLNLSELDGWWAEAYTPDVGWALGDGKEHGDSSEWDAKEAATLYDILEKEVIPEFYDRDSAGIPVKWTNRIRASMAQLTPQYSSNRSVREYTDKYYIPAAINYRARTADNGALAQKNLAIEQQIEDKWHSVRFMDVKVGTEQNHYQFDVRIYLDGLEEKWVKVELYANGMNGGAAELIPMESLGPLSGDPTISLYRALAPTTRPSADYTPRVVVSIPGVITPLEMGHILWQH